MRDDAVEDRDATKTRPRVSAAAVAKAAGVSTATVSYVMNGRAGVSPTTRAWVLQVADELGFAVTAKARRVLERTRVIGLVLADIANPFYPEIAAGGIDTARANGYEVFLAHTQEDPDTLRAVVKTMIARHVDGIVLTVLRADDGDVVQSLRSAHIPYVQLSRRIKQIEADFVGIDDRQAATEMMRHVLDHGYREIATITGPRWSSASAAREESFVGTAAAAGLRISGAHRISTYLSTEGGERAASHLASEGSLPRALVCGSDSIALGVMGFLRARGVRVPEHVAVTGFDGLLSAVSALVDLTTISQPRRMIAGRAVELLIRRIDAEGGPPRSVMTPYRLVIGSTCGCRGARAAPSS